MVSASIRWDLIFLVILTRRISLEWNLNQCEDKKDINMKRIKEMSRIDEMGRDYLLSYWLSFNLWNRFFVHKPYLFYIALRKLKYFICSRIFLNWFRRSEFQIANQFLILIVQRYTNPFVVMPIVSLLSWRKGHICQTSTARETYAKTTKLSSICFPHSFCKLQTHIHRDKTLAFFNFMFRPALIRIMLHVVYADTKWYTKVLLSTN